MKLKLFDFSLSTKLSQEMIVTTQQQWLPDLKQP